MDTDKDVLELKLTEVFKDKYPDAKSIRINGILSYAADGDREKFVKVDLHIGGKESMHIENQLECGTNKACSTPAESSASSPHAPSFENRIEKPLLVSRLSSNSAECTVDLQSAFNTRQNKRKCLKPKRQCFPSVISELDHQNQWDQREAKSDFNPCADDEDCYSELLNNQKRLMVRTPHTLSTPQTHHPIRLQVTPAECRKSFCPLSGQSHPYEVNFDVNGQHNHADQSLLSETDSARFITSSLCDTVALSTSLAVSNLKSVTANAADCNSSNSYTSGNIYPFSKYSPEVKPSLLNFSSEVPKVVSSTAEFARVISPRTYIDTFVGSSINVSMAEKTSLFSRDSEALTSSLKLLGYIPSPNNTDHMFVNTTIKSTNFAHSSPTHDVRHKQNTPPTVPVTRTLKHQNIAAISVCPTLALIGTIEPCIASVSNEQLNSSNLSTILGTELPNKVAEIRNTTELNSCITVNATGLNNTTTVAALLRNLVAFKQAQSLRKGTGECGSENQSKNQNQAMELKNLPDLKEVNQADQDPHHCELNTDSTSETLSTVPSAASDFFQQKPLNVSHIGEKFGLALTLPYVTTEVSSSSRTCKNVITSAKLMQEKVSDVQLLKGKASGSPTRSKDTEETASAIDRILHTIKVCMKRSPQDTLESKNSIAEPNSTTGVGNNPNAQNVQLCRINDKNIIIPVGMKSAPAGMQTEKSPNLDSEMIATDELKTKEISGIVESNVGKKTYRCHYCGKMFNRKFCRERHERLHTGIKPYTCEVCNEKFIRLEDKKRHVRSLQHYQSTNFPFTKDDVVSVDNGIISLTMNAAEIMAPHSDEEQSDPQLPERDGMVTEISLDSEVGPNPFTTTNAFDECSSSESQVQINVVENPGSIREGFIMKNDSTANPRTYQEDEIEITSTDTLDTRNQAAQST